MTDLKKSVGPDILRGFNCYVDGRSFAGQILKATLPVLKITTEDFKAGGMDAAVEVETGMEKLSASIEIAKYDPVLFPMLGLIDGNKVNITLRGAIDRDGETVPCWVVMTGSWNELNMGDWEAGKLVNLKVEMNLSYYQLLIDSAPVVHIDIPGMVRMIGGVDTLSGYRKALGI